MDIWEPIGAFQSEFWGFESSGFASGRQILALVVELYASGGRVGGQLESLLGVWEIGLLESSWGLWESILGLRESVIGLLESL